MGYFNLKWSKYGSEMLSRISALLYNPNLVDCTLCAEGKFLKVHRILLAACSPYFEVSF